MFLLHNPHYPIIIHTEVDEPSYHLFVCWFGHISFLLIYSNLINYILYEQFVTCNRANYINYCYPLKDTLNASCLKNNLFIDKHGSVVSRCLLSVCTNHSHWSFLLYWLTSLLPLWFTTWPQ